MNTPPFADWMRQIQERTEAALAALLPDADVAPTQLHGAMRYAVLGGGKRIRALLTHAAGQISAAPAATLDRAACAVELIHAYSLVHDDMPCMDNDVLRRGKPTVHVQFGESCALLAGDALQTLAFQILAETPLCADPAHQLEMLALLAQASGSRGMAGGQAIDLAATGASLALEELEFMHIHKTGALIRAAIQLGLRCGEKRSDEVLEKLDKYAKLVGLLFQVVDDILDDQADTVTLGKTAGKDADNNKPTYVSLLGIREARELAETLLGDARDAIRPLGAEAARLDELAGFIVHRQF